VTEAAKSQPPDDEARRAARLFLSAVTHELRTPLNGILGMAELLAGSGLKPDQAEYVGAIQESGAHLLALVNDILDISKLESGAVALEPASFDPARLARAAAELLAPKAREKGLEIALIVEPRAPAVVTADEDRLRQVLLNILGNALRFTERGGALVRVSAAQEEGRTILEYSVSDTGAGVEDAARESVFDSFSAGSGANGPGLGLAIARRLVCAMGGELTLADSGLGGAAFSARLPVEGAVRRQSFGEEPGGELIVAARSAIVREALSEQARLLGGRARPAMTAGEARKLVEAFPHATLLMDAAWAASGAEAAAAASRAVALVAPDERSLLAGLRERGFPAYLVKPVRPESLAAVLRGERLSAPSAEPSAEPSGPAAPAPRGDGRKRVLLAEDNPINALLARTTLADAGYAVDHVTDGAAAVEAARATPYDLVLMDMRMPRLGGLEATRRIRALGPPWDQAPILALTANDDAEDRAACRDAGMDAFVTKPLEQARLRRLAERWTNARKQAKLA